MTLREATETLLMDVGEEDGFFPSSVPGLVVMRSSRPTRPQCVLFRPALCLIVQGAKEMTVGETRAIYREGQSLVITADVPTLVHIVEADPERPFVGLGLELDLGAMREIIEQLAETPQTEEERGFGPIVEDTRQSIEDCLTRLIKVSARPSALSVLRSSIMREVYYWLLTGPSGEQITRQARVSGSAKRITDVVHYLRETFTQPIRIDRLAEMVNMSPSSFFQHFKSVTSMTPIQFQKQLRLSEARRLLVMNDVSVAEAAFAVGYESSSQFSREYNRMFGLPPAKDTSFFYDSSPQRPDGPIKGVAT